MFLYLRHSSEARLASETGSKGYRSLFVMCIGEEALTISEVWPRKDGKPDLNQFFLGQTENELFRGLVVQLLSIQV